MSGEKRHTPRSAVSTPTPPASSASPAHSHSPTVTAPAHTLHTQQPHQYQLSPHSIANSNMGDAPNIAMPPTPPADHPGGGNSGGSATRVGAPSFAAVVSASPPMMARSSSTTIYSAQPAQEHVQSSLGANLTKNSDVSRGLAPSVSTDPPQTIIVSSDAHHRSPSGGSLTSSSRYHSPLASPGGSAGHGGHSIHASDVDHATVSIPNLANATVISSPSLIQEEGGVVAAIGSDVEPDTDSAGHDSGESSDDVEIYLDTLGLHDSAARMHVANAGHASSGSTTRSSPNPKPLSQSAQDNQGQLSVSAVRGSPNSSMVGAQALQDQQRQPTSITPPNKSISPSHPTSLFSTLNAQNTDSNLNSGGLRASNGPNSASPSQTAAATGVNESSGAAGLGAGSVGTIARNGLSPLPVPLSNPLSTSPSNSSSAALEHANSLQTQQYPQSNFSEQYQQQRHIPVSNQGRNLSRPSVYSTIPLPEVDDHTQVPQSSDYGHAAADSDRQQQLDLDRQHQHHLQLQQQEQDEQHQRMYGQSGMGSVHGPQGHAEIDISGLAGLSIGGDGRAQQQHQQQQFSLGITSSQTLPSISTSGPFDFDSSPNTYTGPSIDGSGSGFPTSASESTLLGSGAGSASTLNLGPKTPNVYINGLPPHFPEDQLFALASPFGEVRSVRTFTRHVRDSESGYGFVLFETIEAAEKCIMTLRKYRNLHPTFSKQIHKIPGTIYAQGSTGPSSWDEHGSGGSEGSSPGSVNSAPLSAEASFKARMESLQDPTSTNLYMEGLPLSIDEPTLAALVSPHRIISSRFFQTRLSNPPRIIAFVRLETRVGAEEIIERLHGRMVRGWNDAGSRISVRFADTSEQRELRRQERTTQEGDGSPARLTIAQAALLNLRGQQLKASNSGASVASQGLTRNGGFSTSVSAPDFSSNANLNLPPVIGTSGGGLRNAGSVSGGSSPAFEVDYSLAPGRGVIGSRSRSPYQLQSQGQYSLGHTPPPPAAASLPHTGHGADPAMHALLDTLRSTGVPFRPNAVGGGYGDTLSGDYDYNGVPAHRGAGLGHHQSQQYQDQQLHLHQAHHLSSSQSLDNLHHPYGQAHARPAPAYTRSGYTATEEYIMRAHAENAAATAHVQAQHQHQHIVDRRRPAPLDLRRHRGVDEPEGPDYQDPSSDGGHANIAVGVRAYRAQASVGRVGPGQSLTPSSSSSFGMLGSSASMPAISSLGGSRHSGVSASAGASPLVGVSEEEYHSSTGIEGEQRHASSLYSAHISARLAREHYVQRPPMPLSPSLGVPSSNQDSSLSDAAGDTINYQHAAAHMRSTTLPQHRPRERGHYQQNSMSMPAQNLRTPQHASVAVMSGPRGIDGAPGSNDTIHENDGQDQQQQQIDSRDSRHSTVASMNHIASGPARSPLFADLVDSSSTGHSPSLISPTLTYSSQTPSTLSPATPFFGSFHSQSDGFGEKNGVDQAHHHQPKKQASGGAMISSSLRSLTSEGA